MNVPFLNLSAINSELHVQLVAACERVLSSGWYIQGNELRAFETEFASYVGAAHAVGVANGLDALVLSLRALNVGPGDEVVVPSNTFIATWLAVTHVGATPIPVEPDPFLHTIQAAAVAKVLTQRTKAIIPVHFYGQPVDMQAFSDLANASGISLLEDAAQAHGAVCRGKPVGAWGHTVAWSFYPGKNLGALGDGGAVTTSTIDIAHEVHLQRNYGSETKYVHQKLGSNSRLDEIQAALLRVKLRALANHNERRKQIAAQYLAGLDANRLVLPSIPEWAEPVWHLFVVQHPKRDSLQARLNEKGIGTLVHYPTPPHLQPAYHKGKWPKLPVAEALAKQVISLPMGPHLSDEDVENVIHITNEVLKNL